jgi:hypothetical protein
VRRSRASAAHFAACASRLITWRFGRPQKSSSAGHGASRCSPHTRNSGTRWSTSAVFHSRPPVWPQRRACRRPRSLAWSLGAFQNCQATMQAQCQVHSCWCRCPTSQCATRSDKPAGRKHNKSLDLSYIRVRDRVRAVFGMWLASRSCGRCQAARSSCWVLRCGQQASGPDDLRELDAPRQ